MSDKTQRKKKPKPSSTSAHLRGVYNPVSPSKFKQSQLFRYKKPLTEDIKNKFGIKQSPFKYHYHSVNKVLLDYERFVVKFENK